MIHHMKLHQEPFESIKKGAKTIELRLYDEKRQALKSGDLIDFTSPHWERIFVKVVKLHIFNSFQELYETLPLDKCGYDDVSQAKPEDMEMYYSKAEQAKYGVVGIEIALFDP